MANTNAISQMARPSNQVSAGKNTGNTQSREDSFQGMLDKVSGTAPSETDVTETAGTGQDKTETPISKEESETETKSTIQPDLAALVIQSLVGDASSGQGTTAADAQTAAAVTTASSQAAALPVVDSTLPANIASVPIPDAKSSVDTQQDGIPKASVLLEAKTEAKTEVKTEAKAEANTGSKAEGARASLASEATAKDTAKSPLPTAAEGTPASANQLGKTAAPEQASQQQQSQTGSQEQPKAALSAAMADAEPASAEKAAASLEKTAIPTEVNKEAEKTGITPEAAAMKNAPVQDTEVVRIKVAEPFKQVDSKLMNQISDKVQDTVILGKDELVIQLTPEHLGKIAIKISMMDGGIKVVLNCDNLKTQNLLADKAAGIGKIVEDNMNSPVTVQVKDDSYWNQQKNATDQHNHNQGRQQEEQEKQSQEDTDVFIQQLRLGLGGQLTAS